LRMRSTTCPAQHLVRLKLGAPMTAISLAQAARLSNPGNSAVTAGINVDRFSRDNSRREHFGPHNVISRCKNLLVGSLIFSSAEAHAIRDKCCFVSLTA